MSLLDGIISQVSGNAGVGALAAKVGLPPQAVEAAVAALAQAHRQPGDTVNQASQQTGLPKDKLSQIVGRLGGESALGPLASSLEQQGGGGLMGGLSKML